MSVPESGQESLSRGGITYYKGWIYARSCGHELNYNRPYTRRGLCYTCAEWVRQHGNWEDHEYMRRPTQDLIEDIEAGAIRDFEDGERVGYSRKHIYANLRNHGRLDLYRKLKEAR